MPIVGVACKTSGAHQQALFVGHRHTDFDAEFVGFSGLAFADAFNLWRVQRIKFILILALLGANALGALEPSFQGAQRQSVVGCGGHLAPDPANENAKDRALALDHAPEALELFGMGVTARLTLQGLAFGGKGLFEHDGATLGSRHHFAPGNL